MRVERSAIYKFCKQEINLTTGDLFIFDELAILQMHEGILFSRDHAYEVSMAINQFFPNPTPFDFVSNRVNDYSIKPIDLKWFLELFPHMRTYNVVFYESPSRSNMELEALFAPVPIYAHKQLLHALDSILFVNREDFLKVN